MTTLHELQAQGIKYYLLVWLHELPITSRSVCVSIHACVFPVQNESKMHV